MMRSPIQNRSGNSSTSLVIPMTTSPPSTATVSRRSVLVTSCAASCLTLTGCSTNNTESRPAVALGSAEITISEVPVGGGIILPDRQVVITQPEEGLFHAFSAVCTHQGCTVAEIKDGTINCPCHGSKYSIVDGTVVERPAQKSLHEYTFTLTADTIRVN